jgi:hypothetical protein
VGLQWVLQGWFQDQGQTLKVQLGVQDNYQVVGIHQFLLEDRNFVVVVEVKDNLLVGDRKLMEDTVLAPRQGKNSKSTKKSRIQNFNSTLFCKILKLFSWFSYHEGSHIEVKAIRIQKILWEEVTDERLASSG